LKAAKKQWAGAMLSIMLLGCVKTIVKESRNFELTCLKKKKEKERKQFWQFSGLVLLQCFFVPLARSLVSHENT